MGHETKVSRRWLKASGYLPPPNTVKIISQDDSVATVGGYGVVFGGKDVTGETFGKDTDYKLDFAPNKMVYYDHTLAEIKNQLEVLWPMRTSK